MKKRLLIGASLAALLVGAGLAVAQTINPPQVSTINNAKDLIPVIPSGQGTAQSKYATPALVTNAPGYVKLTPTGVAGTTGVGYSNYFGSSQSYLIVIIAGTMSYNYVYAATAPSDGSRECVFASGGALTQLEFTASSGQTVTGGHNISLAANAGACYTYSASNLTWDRS